MPKMPINKGILKEIEWQIPVLKVLGLNPNGITLQNPQETEIQNLVDFFFYTMHHICTTQTYNKVLQIALFSKKRLINTYLSCSNNSLPFLVR